MKEKELIKEIEDLIEKVVKLSEEDSFKAYIYLQHKLRSSPIDIARALQAIWSRRKDWRKEIDRIGKGREQFLKRIKIDLNKLYAKKIEDFYEELSKEF